MQSLKKPFLLVWSLPLLLGCGDTTKTLTINFSVNPSDPGLINIIDGVRFVYKSPDFTLEGLGIECESSADCAQPATIYQPQDSFPPVLSQVVRTDLSQENGFTFGRNNAAEFDKVFAAIEGDEVEFWIEALGRCSNLKPDGYYKVVARSDTYTISRLRPDMPEQALSNVILTRDEHGDECSATQ